MDKLARLVTALVLLVAAGAISADGDHPVPDNMCDAHGRVCTNDSEWVAGWYDMLVHTGNWNKGGKDQRKTPEKGERNSYREQGNNPPPESEPDKGGTCYYRSGECVSAYEYYCGSTVFNPSGDMTLCSYGG